MLIVGHRDVVAFAEDIEACALEGSHDALMRDLRELRHTLISTVLNCVLDVLQGFLFGFALRDASLQGRTEDDIPSGLGVWLDDDRIFHIGLQILTLAVIITKRLIDSDVGRSLTTEYFQPSCR